ncbi:hypothetical protein VT03_16845 [Planctomyces sp. SH-PL14]|nr:hypothetical protein VT03_16845 [Planctomyces sp. SH-PL14]
MRYEVLIDDSVKGPYTLDELQAQLTNGVIWPSTPARGVGQNDWRATADVVEQQRRLPLPGATRGHRFPPPVPNHDSRPTQLDSRVAPTIAVESVIDKVFRVWGWILGSSLLVGLIAAGVYVWYSAKDPDEQRLLQRLGRSVLITLNAGVWKPLVLIPFVLIAFWKSVVKRAKKILGTDLDR